MAPDTATDTTARPVVRFHAMAPNTEANAAPPSTPPAAIALRLIHRFMMTSS